MDIVDLDRRALESTQRFVAATAPEALPSPTPCENWTARDLLDHVIGGNHLFAAAANGATVDWDARSSDWVGSDHRGAYDASMKAVTEAFQDSSAGDYDLPFGRIPASMAIAVHFVDVLVHGWDLAIATAQDPALDDDLCQSALEIVAMYPEDTWGDPKFFRDRRDPPPNARSSDRLVATLGRDPFITADALAEDRSSRR